MCPTGFIIPGLRISPDKLYGLLRDCYFFNYKEQKSDRMVMVQVAFEHNKLFAYRMLVNEITYQPKGSGLNKREQGFPDRDHRELLRRCRRVAYG